MTTIEKVSEILNMDAGRLENESIREFLKKKIRSVEIRIFQIAKKHGIKSIEELDEKIKKGLVEEENIFEDFKEMDYYESEKDKLLNALKEL